MGDELERSVMVQKNVCWKQSNQPQCRSLHPPHNCHYPFFKLRYVWCESSIKLDKPKTTTSGWYISMIAWRYRPILRLSLVFFMSSTGLSHYLQLGNNPASNRDAPSYAGMILFFVAESLKCWCFNPSMFDLKSPDTRSAMSRNWNPHRHP